MILCFVSVILVAFGHFAHLCYAPVAVGYGLSADPLSVMVLRGGSGQSTINVTGKGNPGSWSVTLSASSISGVSTDFNPPVVIIPPRGGDWRSNQSTLTISASGSAPLGVFDLLVSADFGIAVCNVTIMVTIFGSQRETVGGCIEDPDLSVTLRDWAIPSAIAAVVVTVPVAVYARKIRR